MWKNEESLTYFWLEDGSVGAKIIVMKDYKL